MEDSRQQFGRYELVRALGAGGMGEILLARQPGLPGVDRLVVLKKILPHLAREAGFLERFLDETRVAACLSHGNIVQVFEVGEVDGEYFMAMEYVEGMDLKEAFHRLRVEQRRMPEGLALYVLVEIAKALSHAHEKRGPDGIPLGIVHRDVSPANLLLSMDGQVKLTDFGVAKAALRLSLTIPGTLHGKVYYMSPEQVVGDDCDPRADVFSLGVVAYEMLAGRRPFEGTSEMAVLDLVRRCEPPALSEVAPWVPGSLASIVGRAMVRDPAGRYPTMEAFRQALSTYMFEAHTMVSARTLAEFLTGLAAVDPVRSNGPVTPTPGRPGTPRSLDEVAASLLGKPLDTLDGSPTPAGSDRSAHTRTLASHSVAASNVAQRPRFARARRVWPWLAMGLGIAGLAGFVMAWSMVNEPRRDGGSEPIVATQPGPPAQVQTAPGTGLAAAVAPAPAGQDPKTTADPASSVDTQPAVQPTAAEGPASTTPPASRTAGFSRTGTTAAPMTAEPAGPRKINLKSDPPGALVTSGDHELGKTPLEITVPAGGSLRLELAAEGRVSKPLTLTSGSPTSVHVSLSAIPGRVKFRFFPADAEVLIDDRRIETSGNLVDMELPAGAHVLTLKSNGGERSRSTPFDVAPGRDRALGTVELGGGGPSGSVRDPSSQPTPTETP